MAAKDTHKEAIGKLPIVIKLLGKYINCSTKHKFICHCGKEFSCIFSNITTGHIKSCGCARNRMNIKGTKNVSSTYFSRLKKRAEEKQYDFDLTLEFLENLLVKQNFICALSGILIYSGYGSDEKKQTASIDRIDSKRGYIKDNVQWVHKDINNMKQAFSTEKFIEYCGLVYNKDKGKINETK